MFSQPKTSNPTRTRSRIPLPAVVFYRPDRETSPHPTLWSIFSSPDASSVTSPSSPRTQAASRATMPVPTDPARLSIVIPLFWTPTPHVVETWYPRANLRDLDVEPKGADELFGVGPENGWGRWVTRQDWERVRVEMMKLGACIVMFAEVGVVVEVVALIEDEEVAPAEKAC